MKISKGFTLIELLVVLIVIGLFASMLMLMATTNDNRRIEREAKRLIHVLQLAQDEAIIKGVELGLSVKKERYSFSTLQDNRWVLIDADRDFNEYTLDTNMTMSLDVENEHVVEKIGDDAVLPAIVILSSGELTGFKITLSHVDEPSREFEIIGQENGALFLKSPNDE